MSDQSFTFSGTITVSGAKRPEYAQAIAGTVAEQIEAVTREGAAGGDLGEYTAAVTNVKVRRPKARAPVAAAKKKGKEA